MRAIKRALCKSSAAGKKFFEEKRKTKKK